ncbi:hypothetical protein ACQKGI_22165 [Peribacillus muralis]|uniref:Uncharacterized protein n=1 Tax=Peribacillus muralis TaxID=264697 RepID=A0A1B3XIB5_9BACI|nr:hypothetical protein [Peribacillus muralis]AOH52974.1 hypothetical protein ABE28_001195 [Peribacillus muralis]
MAQYNCLMCGQEFKSYNENAKYCSQTCKGTAYIKYQWKKCEQCGEEYKPRKASSKYCSLECSNIGRKNKSADKQSDCISVPFE